MFFIMFMHFPLWVISVYRSNFALTHLPIATGIIRRHTRAACCCRCCYQRDAKDEYTYRTVVQDTWTNGKDNEGEKSDSIALVLLKGLTGSSLDRVVDLNEQSVSFLSHKCVRIGKNVLKRRVSPSTITEFLYQWYRQNISHSLLNRSRF